MKVYRITKAAFGTDLSGNGSRLYGGRWNSEGNYALYTSENRSLCLLETLVHTPIKFLKSTDYLLIEIELPAAAITQEITLNNLTSEWDAWVPSPVTRKIGDLFLKEQQHLVLQVPSVLMPEECNYVINPLHPHMKEVKIVAERKLTYNNRLLQILQ